MLAAKVVLPVPIVCVQIFPIFPVVRPSISKLASAYLFRNGSRSAFHRIPVRFLILLEDVRDNALTPRNVLRRLARSGGQVSRRQFWNAVKCSRDARHDGDFSRASTQHSRLSANMAVKRFDSTPERSDGSFDPHESKFAFLHWVRSPTPGVRLWGEPWSDLYSTSVVRAPHGSTARWGAQED